jgi:hypothetical protein
VGRVRLQAREGCPAVDQQCGAGAPTNHPAIATDRSIRRWGTRSSAKPFLAARRTPRNVDPATKFAFTWLKICLDETGDISEVDPFLTTSTEAEARFVAAAKQWTFRPFTIGGQPMPVCAMARLVYPAAAASEPEVLPMPPPLSRSKKRPRMLSNPRLIEGRRIAGAKNIIPDDETKTAIQRAGAPTLQGTFRVCLDDTGVVESVLPLQSTGVSRYDTQLIAHMRAWRYSPYLVNDEPVPVCTYVTFIYSQR